MSGEIYVFICAVLIPFFDWQQREEGRNYVAMLATGLFVIYWLVTQSVPIAWDTTTMCVTAFIIWATGSLLWSNSRQSWFDLLTFISCFAVFLVARTIPIDTLLPLIYLPGVVFALISIYNRNSDNMKFKYYSFGNRNHTASFMTLYVFIGIWLTFHSSLLFGITVIPLLIAIGISKCRGAHVALICGLTVTAVMQNTYLLFITPVIIAIISYIVFFKGKKLSGTYDPKGEVARPERLIITDSNKDRFLFWLAAVILIIKKPVSGYGLRTFRREYPPILPALLKNRLTKMFIPRHVCTTLVERISTHRVHNDHLELLMELGIIGYLLFVSIFTSLTWAANPLLSGAIVAFAVHGLFFFPLREAHTAIPFFAALGAMAPAMPTAIAYNPYIVTIIILLIIRVMYHILIKMHGLLLYSKFEKVHVLPTGEIPEESKALNVKQVLIRAAIERDPYNGNYLTNGYYYHVFTHPEHAFQYASRCLENYDGGKVRWGVLDQYARALLRLGGFGIARMALKYALHICPGFQQSEELMKQIDMLERQQQGQGA